MKKKTLMALFAIAAFVLSLPSCKSDYFDQERYEELVTSTFPVADIDSLHDWNLLKNVTAIVDLSSASAMEYVVNIYDGIPTDSTTRKITTGAVTGSGVLKFNLPKDSKLNRLYVTAVRNRQCIVDGFFPINNESLYIQPNLDTPTTSVLSPDVPAVEYTYCFEETFPEGGDFDFNDCVMGVSISKSPKALNGMGNYMDITVRLRAVGGGKNIAASMRLVNQTAAQVEEKFTIVRKGWAFFQYAVSYLEDPLEQLKPTQIGDLRIDLFNDAHYAINGGRMDETGTMVPHMAVNTIVESKKPEWEVAEPMSSTYRIEFKDEGEFNDFTFTDLDLFIITAYNSAYYETHLPQFFGMRIIKDYPTKINYVPWALLIPDVFQYPTEGTQICKFSSNLNYYDGAYQMGLYSFGAWARNRNNSTAWSWYHYPQSSLVYPAN